MRLGALAGSLITPSIFEVSSLHTFFRESLPRLSLKRQSKTCEVWYVVVHKIFQSSRRNADVIVIGTVAVSRTSLIVNRSGGTVAVIMWRIKTLGWKTTIIEKSTHSFIDLTSFYQPPSVCLSRKMSFVSLWKRLGISWSFLEFSVSSSSKIVDFNKLSR